MADSVIRITVKHTYGRISLPPFRTALNRARIEMQEFVLNAARVNAGDAVEEGEYMRSIEAIGFSYQGFILQSDVPQAWYLEYGTGLYGPKHRAYEINPRYERALANFQEYIVAKALRQLEGSWPEGMRKTPHSYLKWYQGGSPIYAMQVIAPGMRPEPNLGPAIFDNIDTQEAMIARQIVAAWDD